MEASVFLVQGAGGALGRALVEQILTTEASNHVVATTRDPADADGLEELIGAHGSDRLAVEALDITDEASIRKVRARVGERLDRLDVVITCAGVLHDEARGMWPEKRLADVEPAHLAYSFAVNATGPLLMIKHFHDLFARAERSAIASISARVGSIADNGYGGWYAYRAAKAAQNQFIRTAAIELSRRSRGQIICVGLHPGTVDTPLSEPFQKNVPTHQLQTPATAAAHLLDVIAGLTPADTGQVFDWAGERIEP